MVRVAIDPIRRPWLLLNSPIFMGLSFDVHRSGQSRSDTRQGPPLLSVPAPRSRAAARGRSRPCALTHPLASGTQMRYAGRMDAETMRTVARLARSRADRGSSATHGDGPERLGAARALPPPAVDPEVSADACEANPRASRGRGRPTSPRRATPHAHSGDRLCPGRAAIPRTQGTVAT